MSRPVALHLVVAGLVSNGALLGSAAVGNACGLRVTDRVSAETQNVELGRG